MAAPTPSVKPFTFPSTGSSSSSSSPSSPSSSISSSSLSAFPSTRAEGLAKQLKKLILEEHDRNKSCDEYLKRFKAEGLTAVTIKSTQFSLTSNLRESTNGNGQKTGCHTCGTQLEIDPDQPWIGDHSYPTNLSDHVIRVLNADTGRPRFDKRVRRYLFPQCHECSVGQAAEVLYLNSLTSAAIIELLKDGVRRARIYRLIHGLLAPDTTRNCVKSSGPAVTESEGRRIQALGSKNGCHSDPAHKVPAKTYIADHFFPQEFCTGYMLQVFKLLGLENLIPEIYELRPQCPRCSGHQGGKMSQIATLAQEFAILLGIPVNKGAGIGRQDLLDRDAATTARSSAMLMAHQASARSARAARFQQNRERAVRTDDPGSASQSSSSLT